MEKSVAFNMKPVTFKDDEEDEEKSVTFNIKSVTFKDDEEDEVEEGEHPVFHPLCPSTEGCVIPQCF